MREDDLKKFISSLNPEKYKLNESLAKYTTVKIGGPADVLYQATDTEDFINTIKLARENNISVTVLGRGANVLIADRGIRGLTIKNLSRNIAIGDENITVENPELETEIEKRWESANESDGARKMYEFKDLDYDESDSPRVEVKIDSGVDMPYAVNFLIQNGVTGLQWFARIPGTLGGWIHNNIHGGSHFLIEVIKDVTVLTPENEVKILQKNELNAGYDQSRFHDSGEIILSATLNFFRGDVNRAKAAAMEWAKRKSVQPTISVGCVFKNISQADKEKFNYPTTSAGYIIEHVLGMSDFHIGDAYISTAHHNFIVNNGEATAKDYIAVINEIQKRTKEKLGIELVPEIFYLGEFVSPIES